MLTPDQKKALEQAIESKTRAPEEVETAIKSIIDQDVSASSTICCRYYDLGSFRYARTSAANCRLVSGEIVGDENCG